ncbi:MAG TPA: CPBP family intramembrane glutamic endopeptidase [Steroidobacteraceae bacterium]|nr:CPBP family intramembrane glutamic endopeptidase [Steroidobacteraceae bacterium]
MIRSTLLLIRLRLRRLVNLIAAGSQGKKKPNGKTRTGNPGKKSSKVILYLAWPMMLFAFGAISFNSVMNLHGALDAPGTFWVTVEFSTALAIGVAFLLFVLWFSSLLVTIGSGELAKPEWDLEWLITLPIRSDTLLWARIAERSVVNPSGAIALIPACTAIAWYSGYRWTAPLIGVLAAWPLLVLAALARTLIDTGLRLRLRPAQLRNLHAAISVLSIISMYLAISIGLAGKADFMLALAVAMPEWLMYTPMGLVVRLVNERTFSDTAWLFVALSAEVSVIVWLGVRLLRHVLRHGVVAGGAREGTRNAPNAFSAIEATPVAMPPAARGRIRLSAVQRRELTLLCRDRNFLVQSLVLPLLIVGGQMLLGTSGAASTMWTNPNVLASVAFGLAAYSLSMSAFQTINSEGQALWLLYTFPCSIEDVLKDKAKLWGVLTLAYPLAMFAAGAVMAPSLDWNFLAAMLTALLGIPIYAFIAVALGVFGSNPLEQQHAQKVKPAYVYLYMTLSALYVYAIVTPQPVQRLIFMVLSMLLAAALWQKARDQLGFLLDPDASPPPRVSTSDGLIAAMVFFVSQAVAAALIVGRGRVTGAAVLFAFSIGGAVTYALMRSVYAKAGTEGVPRMFGDGPDRPLLGVVAGLAASAAALLYLFGLDALDLLESARRASQSYASLGLWTLPLALIAAPIFEEFIFRGLIFGGLRRSFGLWPAALASAAIFAIVHPAFSIVPVFFLGVCAALVYDRSRSLLAPMITHGVYNGAVIGAQTFLL